MLSGEKIYPSISILSCVSCYLSVPSGNIDQIWYFPPLFDKNAMAPYFQYTDIDGNIPEVWFEDARSINAKADLIKKH